MSIPRYSNVVELIEKAYEQYAERPAYTCLGQSISYGELQKKSLVFASYLQNELGLKAGDRFAIQLPNLLQFPIAMYGAIQAGLVIVNINPLYTPREVQYQLNDSGAKAFLVLSNVASNSAEIIRETGVEHVIVTNLGDEHPGLKGHLLNFVVKHVKKMVPPFHFDNAIKYRDVFKAQLKEIERSTATSEDLLVLQYTGGTTGVSKGAMLSHGNLASNVWQMISHLPTAFEENNEVFVACLPLYHIYALNLHGLAAFSAGCHNILIPNPRDLASIVKALKNQPFTVFIGINTLFRALTRFEAFSSLDFSSLKITSAGGMALTEDAALDWEKMTGCKVCEGYGLTETSPVLTGNPFGAIRLGSIGTALPETELLIIDEHDKPVEEGGVGELCARGPQVMSGYWHKPEETKAAFLDNGYFRTGDMAQKLDGGYYKLVDRKKDLIIVSGFNVYPNEIEDVIAHHPGVVEAAAIGVKDDECGEIVKLFVVRENESLSTDEVIAYCRENLTRYKVPKQVEFKSELPKSNVGKILRRELRE